MRRTKALFTVLALLYLMLGVWVSAQEADVGPSNGYLVVVGGAMRDPAILNRFIQLAGGPEAPIVIIPTAGSAKHYDQYWSGMRSFREAGIKNLTVLHTRDRAVADSEEFVRPIQNARGVFISGGRQWRLADSYLNTRTHRELLALLERGGVIGGSSAGATIQGSFLARGDSKTNTIMVGDHLEGFGFLRNVAIDQHLIKRNRHFDLIEVIEKFPKLLGIGIDENTAIIVHGNNFDVIGDGYVAIYDNNRIIPPKGQFYFLAPGDRYNLKTRKAFRITRNMKPLERVKEGKWRKEEEPI